MKLVASESQLKKPFVWLEIDTKKIQQNITSMRSLAPGKQVMAVLKANAYGLGAAGIANNIENYVDMFGVVGVSEGLALRAAGVTKPVINLGVYSPDDAEALIDTRISPSIFTEAAYRDFDMRTANKKTVADVWIKVDTGLGRLGIGYDDACSYIQKVAQSSSLNIRGIYSTLTEDQEFDKVQLDRFLTLKQECERNNVNIPIWSIASSNAAFLLPDSILDMVRIGISIFGYYPSQEAKDTQKVTLKPAVAYKTRIACIKELEKAESIFYRRKYVAKQKTRIAVLLPGYSYGLDPRLAQGGNVLIKGKKYPLVGGISATNCFADIGMNENIQASDEVVLFGTQEDAKITLDEVCNLLNQNPYEVLSRIPEKVTRLYT